MFMWGKTPFQMTFQSDPAGTDLYSVVIMSNLGTFPGIE